MNFEETVNYLFSRLPMYQREGRLAFKKDLTNTYALLSKLGNPHQKFKSIHIAGTNGKGTTAHGIAAILQTAGYNTGLYTSPHLKSFTERVKVNGAEVSESFVIEFVAKIRDYIEEINPSFFEITVAMAFEYFAKEKVDIAVVETGLGGRLDSTNVITPEVSAITNIGYDHMDILGETFGQIAREKAGIIKKGVPVVIGEYHQETFPVFIAKAQEQGARLVLDQTFTSEDSMEGIPYHKAKNRDTVFALSKVLQGLGWNIQDEDVTKGYTNSEKITGFKGRFHTISNHPLIVADIAHNESGLSALFNYINHSTDNEGEMHIVFGAVRDKNLAPILNILPANARFYWTQSSVPRSLSAENLNDTARDFGLKGFSYSDVNEALENAKKNALTEDIIVVTGSTFVVSELNEL